MSWRKVKLGTFLKHRENRFKPNDSAIAGLKRIDKIDFSGQIFLSGKSSKTDMILIQPGELVISGINVEKGAMAVYEGDANIVATIHYSNYSYDPLQIDVDFLSYYLRSPEFRDALKEQVPGGIKTEIKPKHLLPLLIEIPIEVEEQREIVKALNKNEAKTLQVEAKLDHQLDLLKKLRQSFLQDAVQGRLVAQDAADEPATVLLQKIRAEKDALIATKKIKKDKPLPPIRDEEIPFEVPEGWVWCRLGDFLSLLTSGSRDWKKYYSTSGAVFIRAQNVKKYGLDMRETAYVSLGKSPEGARTRVRVDDLLITITGAGVSQSGRVTDEIASTESYVSQHIALARPLLPTTADWLELLLRYQAFGQLQLEILAHGDKPGLNLPNIARLPIPIPPLAEQRRIVAKLETLLAGCDSLEHIILQSKEEVASLSQVALREALQPDMCESS